MAERISLAMVAAHAGVSVGTVSNYLNRPEVLTSATAARVAESIEALGYRRAAGRERTPAGELSADVGIATVASTAGVSVGTVSNFLNRPEMVAPETSRRVQEAIDELRYVRNIAARNLRLGHSRSIGLLVLDVGNPFFTDFVKGVEAVAGAAGYAVILGNTEGDTARQEAYLNLFQEQRVSGIIISPTGDVDARIRELRLRGTRAVLIAEERPHPEYSSLSTNDYAGAQLAINHLLATGRRRIAFITGPSRILQVQSRLAGVVDAMEAAGASASLTVIEAPAFTAEAGRSVGEAVLGRSPLPDAVFASNDLLALGVLQAAFAAELRVPQDVALIGYDDISYAAGAAVPLSSIRQASREMGAEAARMLLEEFDSADAPQHRHVTFQPELVVRRSTELVRDPARGAAPDDGALRS